MLLEQHGADCRASHTLNRLENGAHDGGLQNERGDPHDIVLRFFAQATNRSAPAILMA
jgi:hypothetical protein